MTKEAIDAMCLQMILELIKLGEDGNNAINKANQMQIMLYKSYGFKEAPRG